ncbi:hypothetical protein C8Q78DRAFT_807672 [Trametes maxima]|nr:hypothetical protein C8Q78DRAFT_807672 [Trametes maxima]
MCEHESRAPSAPANLPMALALSTLNGDVLCQVASHVRGRDALSLALTSHRIFDFAIHRVNVALVCRTRTDLIRLHSHLLTGSPKRAVYLRSLTILGPSFIERPWQEDPNWIFPKNTYEYSLATLVGDILSVAPNLTHLLLEHCAPLFQHDPRIGTAIASMSNIARLELRDVDDNVLPLFVNLRSRPRVLHISPVKTDSAQSSRVLAVVRSILEAVSPIQELHALDLDLKDIPGLPESKEILSVSLPQIQHLSVHWWHPQFDVAKTFPNVTVFEQHVNSTQIRRAPQHQQAPLRRLSVTELQTFEAAKHPVHLLHLRRYPRELRAFRRTMYETSPVGIALHCFIDTPVWLKYWQQLPRAAPRLRFMDVHCHTWERRHEPGWVNNFVQTLRRYKLVSVRIVAPPPPTHDALDAPWDDADVQTLAELPDRIAQAVPTLRYIAWAAKRRDAGAHLDDYVWYEEGYDCAPADYTWYRVERSGEKGKGKGSDGERTLRVISASEGERVRRFLLDSELDEITNIDEHLRL